LNDELGKRIQVYFAENTDTYLLSIQQHLIVSAVALLIASVIGIIGAFFCLKYVKQEKWITGLFQILRIVPSLAVLLLLLPLMGAGLRPALTALVILAVPSILLNTIAGLRNVSSGLLEAAYGMGMTESQALWKVQVPLAMPLILTGVKTAIIEIVASATLASKIGAGGLGDLIFTGLGLNRFDLLLIGGLSVALIAVAANLILDLTERNLVINKFKNEKRGFQG